MVELKFIDMIDKNIYIVSILECLDLNTLAKKFDYIFIVFFFTIWIEINYCFLILTFVFF